MTSKKVSILCAFRNEIRTIKEHLQSLVAQTHKNKEIIIIDDESSDGSTEIARQFAKKYRFVHYYRIKHPVGGSHTDVRLWGIKKVKGEIIFVVDADAYYSKEYIALALQHLRKKEVAGVIGKMRIWNPTKVISKYRDVWYTYKFDNHEYVRSEIKEGRVAAWIFKKKLYDYIGGYNPKDRYGEDVDLAIRFQKAGYQVVYEPKAIWYHKWEDTCKSIIKKHFMVGRFNFYNSSRKPKMVAKVVYFAGWMPLIVAAVLMPRLWVLVALHPVPLLMNNIKKLYLCRNVKNRAYILLYTPISYLINTAYTIGFISKIIKP